MSKEANPFRVGLFVLGAMALLVFTIVFFGSAELFKKTDTFVFYFSGSVKGLQVGAPVSFKGVPIGKVTDIDVLLDPSSKNLMVPVHAEIDEESIALTDPSVILDNGEVLPILIERGLKAQLQMLSFVTGLLFVNLDFHPEKKISLMNRDPGVSEIPTIASSLDMLSKDFQQLPLQEIAANFKNAVESLNKILASEDAQDLIPKLNSAIDSVSRAFDTINNDLPGTVEDIKAFSGSAAKAAEELDRVLLSIDSMVSEDSEFRYDLKQAIKESSQAMRELRKLLEYLERNPNAVVYGK